MKKYSEITNWLEENRGKFTELSDKIWAGIGSFSRYGLGTQFDSDWAGRYMAYKSIVETFSVIPNIAFKLTDKLSLAAGIEVMYLTIDLRRTIDATQYVYAQDPAGAAATLTGLGLSPTVNDPSTSALDVDTKIMGENVALGFNLALHYLINDEWSLGLTYRSQVTHQVSGDASFDRSALTDMMFGPMLFQDTGAAGSITLPDSVTLGLSYSPTEDLSFEIDAIYTRWSTYGELTFNFDELTAVGLPSSTTETRWNDVWRFQFGVEYSPIDWLDLRLGYIYDQSPIEDGYEDYRLPANDRNLASAGVGFHFGNFSLDLSYTYLWVKERDVDARTDDFGFPEMYKSHFEDGDAHIYGLSLGYNF